MKKNSTILSERLKFVPLSVKHLSKRYVKWLNDEDVIKYLVVEKGETIESLNNYLKEVEKKQNYYFWAILLRSNNKHIGNVKVDPILKRHGLGTFGLMIGDTSEYGKGYGKEASITIINYCFEVLNLRKITLGVVEENRRALDLYTKIGFQVEGRLVKHFNLGDHYSDSLFMAIFKENFNNGR